MAIDGSSAIAVSRLAGTSSESRPAILDNCYIEGHVDFIFGGARPFSTSAKYTVEGWLLTAPATPDFQPFGLCSAIAKYGRVAGSEDVSRPAVARLQRVTYINTEMSENVQPAGWDN